VPDFSRAQVGIPEGKLKTTATGVGISRFRSAHPTSRAACGWEDEDVVIGCVARLEPEKAHDLLLDAFRQVRNKHHRVRLLLIGDGGEKERLTQMADALGLNGSVLFLGVRDNIPELL